MINDLRLGGSQQVVASLANHQAAQGHQVGIVAAAGELDATLDTNIVRFALPASASSRMAGVRLLRGAIKSEAWSVVHTHQRRNALVVNAVRGKHGPAHVEHVHNTFPIGPMSAISFRADALVACGTSVGRMLTVDFGRDPRRVHIVLNGIPDHGVRRTPKHSVEGPLRVVNIARASDQKDPLRFVRVIAALCQSGTTVAATWIGGGNLLDAARDLTARLSLSESLSFVGSVSGASAHLSSADVLFMTSRWEGLPLVALEACAAGVPVVGPDVGSLADVVSPGVNGYLYAKDQSDHQVAEVLAGMFRSGNEIERMSTSSRRIFEDRFTLERFSQEVALVYDGVIRARQ